MKLRSIAICAAFAAATLNGLAQQVEAAPVAEPYGSAVRTEYASISNVQRRQSEKDVTYCDVYGSSIAAISLFPAFEAPCANYEIDGLRLNIGVGEHVDVYGVDLGVIGNKVRREVGGLQIGVLFNTAGESGGALQIAAICNYVTGDFSGAQIGLFNLAEKGCGLQVGLVNKSVHFQGLQIGVLNFNEASPVSFFPIVNFAF